MQPLRVRTSQHCE